MRRLGCQREATLCLCKAGCRGRIAIVADGEPELGAAVLSIVLEALGTARTDGFEDHEGIAGLDVQVDGLLEGGACCPFETEADAIDLEGFDADALPGEVNHAFAAQGLPDADFADAFGHIDVVFEVAVEGVHDVRAFERGICHTRDREDDQGARVVAVVVTDVDLGFGGVPFLHDALHDKCLRRCHDGEAEGCDGQETE